jgi:3-methylfumaryl-CoA hydratase
MSVKDWIGNRIAVRDQLTDALVARYRATLGGPVGGGQAPLGIHWCLGLPDAPSSALGPDGHPKKGGFLPPIPLPRRMWASSQVAFLAPLQIGDEIERVSVIKDVRSRTGRSGSLIFVTIEHTTAARQTVCVREQQTLVYRGERETQILLPADTGFDGREIVDPERVMPSSQLLFRYSALTFNTHRIHYDSAYTKTVEGYPGLVVQGPLMASLLLRYAGERIGEGAIQTFSFKGLTPAYCDQNIYLGFTENAPETGLIVLGSDGRKIMSGSINQAFPV